MLSCDVLGGGEVGQLKVMALMELESLDSDVDSDVAVTALTAK